MQANSSGWQPNSQLAASDPELNAIYENLINGEILKKSALDDVQKALVTISALAANQNSDALAREAASALQKGVAPAAIREALYQCAPYIGLPRVEEALIIVNKAFKQAGIALPLAAKGTVTSETRLQKGLETQRNIFGAENIDKMRENAPEGQKELIANYLSAFCFGDFYTRQELDLKMRELVTFSAIVALGGCDPQAKAHAHGNMAVGNTKQNLIDALAMMLPYIGFPRTLNGLAAVNGAIPEN